MRSRQRARWSVNFFSKIPFFLVILKGVYSKFESTLNDATEIEKVAEAYDFPPPDYSKKNMVQFKKYNRTISFYRTTSTAQPLEPDFPCERNCRLRTFTVIIEQFIRAFRDPERKIFYLPQVKRSRDSSPEAPPAKKRMRSRTPAKERLSSRSSRSSIKERLGEKSPYSRPSPPSRKRRRSRSTRGRSPSARRMRSRSIYGRSPSTYRKSRHPRFRKKVTLNECHQAPKRRKSFSRLADEINPPSKRRLASAKTSTPVETNKKFEFTDSGSSSNDCNTSCSKETSTSREVSTSPEKSKKKGASKKADKKKKLVERTKIFKDYLKKSLERLEEKEVKTIKILTQAFQGADKTQLLIDYLCLGGKEETSWIVKSKHELILFVILSRVSACITNTLVMLFQCSYLAIFSTLSLFLSFQADKFSRNQCEVWLPIVSYYVPALMNS